MATETSIDPKVIFNALGRVSDEATFIQELFAVTLNWPIPDESIVKFEDISYDWEKDSRKAPNIEQAAALNRAERLFEVNFRSKWIR